MGEGGRTGPNVNSPAQGFYIGCWSGDVVACILKWQRGEGLRGSV